MTTFPKAMSLATASGLLVLLSWGCAMVPPNQSPGDPFATVEPGLGPVPQRSARPVLPNPSYQQPTPAYRQPAPSFQPPTQRSAPNRAAQPTPLFQPNRPASPPSQRATPKTFADPEPKSRAIPPQRPAPYRTDKAPSRQDAPPQTPPSQPAVPDGPKLGPPEDAFSASNTSLPKNAAQERVELAVSAPQRRPVGSGAPFQLTIRNLGDEPLRNVSVVCEFDEALTFPGSDRKSVTHKIPKIDAGDSKESLLTLVSDTAGSYRCRFTVNVGSQAVVNKSVAVEFVSRQLDWNLHGPAERTVGSRAEFNIPLINVSQRKLTDLTVRVELDSALTIREMTQGGKLGDRSVTWTIDQMAANEGLLLQLEVECAEPTMLACLRATVSGAEVPADDAEACLTVKPVTGLLDVRVQDVSDPVAVNDEAELSIVILNHGLQAAKDVAVTCTWPDGFEFVGAVRRDGSRAIPLKATARGRSASLTTVPRLDANETLEFRVRLAARLAGPHQLTVSVTDSTSETPVEVIEPIMVHR